MEEGKKVTFNPQKFAEGRFRNAYMGTWERPYYKYGDKCVVKEKKSECCWSINDWDTIVKIVKKAQVLAAGFNRFSKTTRPITFEDVEVFRVTQRSDPNAFPKVNEYVTVETYLEGSFQKWCNNYGFISSEAASSATSMPAFMHWSWVHTKGELMIADLQGVRQDDSYALTDPVIMSLNRQYGETDTGVEGMLMFFIHHKCNQFCNGLPRPTANDFLNHPRLPRYKVETCIQMVKELANSTTYKHELKLDDAIRKIIIQTLKAFF